MRDQECLTRSVVLSLPAEIDIPANNIEMLLVMPSTFVLRALTLMGLDGVPVYLTLDGALAHGDPSPDQTGRH
jgi:hypothetical protein